MATFFAGAIPPKGGTTNKVRSPGFSRSGTTAWKEPTIRCVPPKGGTANWTHAASTVTEPTEPSPSSPSSTSDRDAHLAELLSTLMDQVGAGVPVNIESVCRNHPDLSDELRQLWSAVLVTDAAAIATGQQPYFDAIEATSSTGTDAAFAASSGLGRFGRLALPAEFGDYRLLEEIGRGGMGVVYRALQKRLNREVALKMILRSRLADPSDMQRFRSEAEAAARLEHENIVKVYEVGEFDGRPYFSMQYIPGPSLADVLKAGPLPQRRAARIVAAVARAIQCAHDRGMLHRDLKPANILLTDDDTPLVTDFGLATQFTAPSSGLTLSGAVVGTPSYMSPEQAAGRRGGPLSPASDIYSLGCILYATLTGRPPLVAESSVELLMMVLEQDPPPPRALRPQLDRDLEMIVIRCLQKPADLRYRSAGALADDLQAFLHDERVQARSGGFGQIVARLFRETHHAAVLENWGVLWMWHSLVLLVASLLTWCMELNGVDSRLAYGSLWTVGLGAWASVFWMLRRRLGPVTFIERQVAHVWGASLLAIGMLFPLEALLGLPVLTLSPLLGVIAAMVFLIKAGMLAGRFYLQTASLVACSLAMVLFPRHGHLIFGATSATCFFLPGLKYYRRSRT